MNTLSRARTVQILLEPEAYQNLRRHWSELVRSPRKHELTAAHHLLYLALLGKDWRKAFTFITNQRKLENGAFYGWGLFQAMAVLHTASCEGAVLAPFGGLVTPAMLAEIRRLVPYRNKYSYRPEQFGAATFPFEAYSVPASV